MKIYENIQQFNILLSKTNFLLVLLAYSPKFENTGKICYNNNANVYSGEKL